MSLFDFVICRDWARGEGWLIGLSVARSPHLMRANEQGHLILCGLFVGVWVRAPWGRRSWAANISAGDWFGWRNPLCFTLSSNAHEIACRLAESSGWKVR